jgi:hypothetical protein
VTWQKQQAERVRQSVAAASVTGRAWCAHGAHYAPTETVRSRSTPNGRRTICAVCEANRAARTGAHRSKEKV